MDELGYQKWTVDSVIGNGGHAHKMSHRFIVGVADLMIKLPQLPAALLEVKLQHIGATTKLDHEFQLDVTELQKRFLKRYHLAGMACGILSFIERGRMGKKAAGAAVFSLEQMDRTKYHVQVSDHAFDLTDNRLCAIVMQAVGIGQLQLKRPDIGARPSDRVRNASSL